jgi:hypothetical protein
VGKIDYGLRHNRCFANGQKTMTGSLSATLSGTTTIDAGQSTSLTLTLGGAGPWTVNWSAARDWLSERARLLGGPSCPEKPIEHEKVDREDQQNSGHHAGSERSGVCGSPNVPDGIQQHHR